MDENLTDQQRAEQVRGWLRENGWYLLAGLALGLGALFGWRQWTNYGSSNAEQASALFEEMLAAIRVDRVSRAEEIATQLAADYGSTPYVDQARLAMAKVKLERSLPDEAVKYLEEVVKSPGSPQVGSIAKLRLARVLAQEEKYEDALKLLVVPADSAFETLFHEVRGDVYFAMGRADEARAEYEAALKGDQSAVGDQAFLQAKLTDLGAAPDAGAAAAMPAPAAAPSAAPAAQ